MSAARVFFQRNARIAALLRAVVHQAVLADVQVAASGAAPPPVVRLAGEQVSLIRIVLVDAAVGALGKLPDLLVDAALAISHAASTGRRRRGSRRRCWSVSTPPPGCATASASSRIADAGAEHRVDVHVKLGMVATA